MNGWMDGWMAETAACGVEHPGRGSGQRGWLPTPQRGDMHDTWRGVGIADGEKARQRKAMSGRGEKSGCNGGGPNERGYDNEHKRQQQPPLRDH